MTLIFFFHLGRNADYHPDEFSLRAAHSTYTLGLLAPLSLNSRRNGKLTVRPVGLGIIESSHANIEWTLLEVNLHCCISVVLMTSY